MKSQTKTIGTPKTIKELKELINKYPDSTPFGFRNQPIQELVETTDGTSVYVSFQEIIKQEWPLL